MGKIQSKKQSRKLGRYEMSLVIRLQPSSRQCENAARLLGGGSKTKGTGKLNDDALKDISVPTFSAKGLVLKRSSGEVFTHVYIHHTLR